MADDAKESAMAPLRDGQREARELGAEVAGIATDLRDLARMEVELAQAELGENVGRVVRLAAFGAAAAIVALLAVVFLCWAALFALDNVMPQWAAALCVAGALVVFAAVAGWLAFAALKGISVVPRRTVQSLKEDARWAKTRLQSSSN